MTGQDRTRQDRTCTSYACICVRDVYVCMFACMYTCMYVCMYVCVYLLKLQQGTSQKCPLATQLLLPMTRPTSSDSEAWLAALHSAAAMASDAFVEVVYLGHLHGRRAQPLYRAHPHDWKLKPSERRDRVVVCFSWQPRGSQAGPAITKQSNDHARGRPLVRPPALTRRSVPCVSWAVRALEIVEHAAKTFVQLHGPELQR